MFTSVSLYVSDAHDTKCTVTVILSVMPLVAGAVNQYYHHVYDMLTVITRA